MNRGVARLVFFALFFGLSACGGGGSSGGSGGNGGGGTGNSPPSFTNASSFTYEESRGQTDTRIVVQLTATDPDADTLAFEIVAGKDSAQFIFSGTSGALAFGRPVSFETPRDSNGYNIYEVDVRVSDGTASTTQTIRIQVTDSREGLVVRRVATGLIDGGVGGSLVYLADRDRVLVVAADGKISVVDPVTGSVSAPVYLDRGGSAQVLDIAVDSVDARSGNFFAIVREGPLLALYYVNIVDGSTRFLWGSQLGQDVSASLAMRGSNVQVAISSSQQPALAQDLTSSFGKVILMQGSGSLADPAAYSVTPQTVGWGLRDPKLLTSTSLQGAVIDAAVSTSDGFKFNEFNRADFEISQASANFEFPIRDGLTDFSFAGTVSGTRVAPRVVQEFNVNGAGRWLDAAESLQGNGWFGVLVISDDRGNIFTYDTVNGGQLENRTLDFTPSVGTIARIVSMDDGDRDVGNAIPIFMLESNGQLFLADLVS